jgi:hypothetical protein
MSLGVFYAAMVSRIQAAMLAAPPGVKQITIDGQTIAMDDLPVLLEHYISLERRWASGGKRIKRVNLS